jgi:hypothetical protein
MFQGYDVGTLQEFSHIGFTRPAIGRKALGLGMLQVAMEQVSAHP